MYVLVIVVRPPFKVEKWIRGNSGGALLSPEQRQFRATRNFKLVATRLVGVQCKCNRSLTRRTWPGSHLMFSLFGRDYSRATQESHNVFPNVTRVAQSMLCARIVGWKLTILVSRNIRPEHGTFLGQVFCFGEAERAQTKLVL